MANISFADRVHVNTDTIGAGTMQLRTALAGFRTFAQAVTDGHLTSGATVYYCIEDGVNWEVGQGTYTAGSPDTLTRTVIASSSGGSAIGLTGAAQVFIAAPSLSLTTINVRVVTAAGLITQVAADRTIVVNKTTGAASAVNLLVAPLTGSRLSVKDGKGDALTNPITVTAGGGLLIDGNSTFILNQAYASVDFIYNGSAWNVL